MDEEEMIQKIIEYAETHPDWDSEFIYSIRERVENGGTLTSAQHDALERIIERYRL